MVGFDCEWDKQDASLNRALCYSFHGQLLGGPSWSGVIYCQDGKRLTLASLLRHIIEAGRKAGHLRRWPKALTLVGHWTLSDLAMLADFPKLQLQFSSIRNTYVTLQHPLKVPVHDSSKHRHVIAVTLRDTLLLTPGGSKSLDSLGALLGEPRVELSDGQIERMAEPLERDPELFDRYARQDPTICVAHALQLLQLNEGLTGRAEVPVTLSGLGEAFLLGLWESKGVSRQQVLGIEELVERAWNPAKGRLLPRKSVRPEASRHLFETLATECFHGGLNVQFLFGAGPMGTWLDVDLAGAYSVAMSLIGMPDWERLRSSTNLDDYGPLTLGFAHVRFRFPPGTRYPCLPVATEHGPLFPLSGTSFCCSPEICLARKLGAHLAPNAPSIPGLDSCSGFVPGASQILSSRRGSPPSSGVLWVKCSTRCHHTSWCAAPRPTVSSAPRRRPTSVPSHRVSSAEPTPSPASASLATRIFTTSSTGSLNPWAFAPGARQLSFPLPASQLS
ncbi:MAG: hypothetical protein EBT61_01225 [Verrucomicrobia bacterium]|nr:hypothetical protein [Verrucomicrobiota bacterium]